MDRVYINKNNKKVAFREDVIYLRSSASYGINVNQTCLRRFCKVFIPTRQFIYVHAKGPANAYLCRWFFIKAPLYKYDGTFVGVISHNYKYRRLVARRDFINPSPLVPGEWLYIYDPNTRLEYEESGCDIIYDARRSYFYRRMKRKCSKYGSWEDPYGYRFLDLPNRGIVKHKAFLLT